MELLFFILLGCTLLCMLIGFTAMMLDADNTAIFFVKRMAIFAVLCVIGLFLVMLTQAHILV